MAAHKKKTGDHAEQRACKFLQAHGLKVITQNYRCKLGEIDLIMQDGEDVVFVEVRSRISLDYGSAIESISRNKQKKVINTSLCFLQQRNWLDKKNCRFDVIGIHQHDLEWIKDAFTADIL
jgi:putative endonuclease